MREWGVFVCVCVCVCVCAGSAHGSKEIIVLSPGEKSFHAHRFGPCPWIDKGLKSLLLVKTVLPIAKRGWRGVPTLASLPGILPYNRLVNNIYLPFILALGRCAILDFSWVCDPGVEWRSKKKRRKNSPKTLFWRLSTSRPLSFSSSFCLSCLSLNLFLVCNS